MNFAKFYICIHIDKIYVGIVTRHFSHICTRVMAFDVPQNFVSPQYQQIVIISPTLTRSTLGFSHDIFRIFAPELWPLICPKISFPLNFLRTNCHKFTKFYICIHIDKIYDGIVTRLFFAHLYQRYGP